MVAAGSKVKFMGFISKSYALTFLATCLFFSSNFYFVPILPTYLSSIGCNRSEIGAVIGVFSITSIFLRPFFGRVSDSFSKKMLMIFGLS
ncbi:MAG: MFS transporter, partial [Firmicutes bacterium]|nr:MFS transporter [Bacillota bacterium]